MSFGNVISFASSLHSFLNYYLALKFICQRLTTEYREGHHLCMCLFETQYMQSRQPYKDIPKQTVEPTTQLQNTYFANVSIASISNINLY